MRLDKYLVERGFFESRTRAREAIESEKVKVDGKIIKKSSFKIDFNSKIEVEESKFYVSRASGKLEGYFKEYPMNIEGLSTLDIGSSTGGFTQILLEKGVASVDAVDVGREQMHPMLRQNPKLRLFEERDIRGFDEGRVYDLVVSDVSFISLHKILDDIDRLAKSDIILLFKPQFEVGKDAPRDKRGVVKDIETIKKARREFEEASQKRGWTLLRTVASSVTGKEGNQEYIYHFKKADNGKK